MNVLALDGGGIRGLVSLLILQEIEKITNISIQSHFDYFIGTSTGGIISCGLTYSENNDQYTYNIQDLINLFYKEFPVIFPVDSLQPGLKYFISKYSNKGLLSVLKNKFGEAPLSACVKTILIPSYNATANSPFYFSNSSVIKIDEMDLKFDTTKIWEACMATSAAPIYFPTFLYTKFGGEKVQLVDGGVFLNSPSHAALIDLVTRIPDEEVKILSIGTGHSRYSLASDRSKNWGIWPWIKKEDIFKIMMDGVRHHSLHSVSKALNNQFLRLDPILDAPFCKIDGFNEATFSHWKNQIFNQFFGNPVKRKEIRDFFGLK